MAKKSKSGFTGVFLAASKRGNVNYFRIMADYNDSQMSQVKSFYVATHGWLGAFTKAVEYRRQKEIEDRGESVISAIKDMNMAERLAGCLLSYAVKYRSLSK